MRKKDSWNTAAFPSWITNQPKLQVTEITFLISVTVTFSSAREASKYPIILSFHLSRSKQRKTLVGLMLSQNGESDAGQKFPSSPSLGLIKLTWGCIHPLFYLQEGQGNTWTRDILCCPPLQLFHLSTNPERLELFLSKTMATFLDPQLFNA